MLPISAFLVIDWRTPYILYKIIIIIAVIIITEVVLYPAILSAWLPIFLLLHFISMLMLFANWGL